MEIGTYLNSGQFGIPSDLVFSHFCETGSNIGGFKCDKAFETSEGGTP